MAKTAWFSLILIATILNLPFQTQGQSRKEIKELRSELKVLRDSIAQLEKEIYKLRTAANETAVGQERLKLQIEKSSTVLNDVVTSFSNVYTVMTIIIGIIGVALVPLTYIFGILPARRQMKKTKETLRKTLKEYHRESRSEKVGLAIRNIAGPVSDRTAYSLSYLNVTPSDAINDSQLFDLFVASKTADTATQQGISNILRKKHTTFADEYFKEKLGEQPGNKTIKYDGLIYFAKKGLDFQKLDLISNWILTSAAPGERYKEIIGWLQSEFLKELVKLIDHDPLNGKLNQIDVEGIFNLLQNEAFKEYHDAFAKSKLFQYRQKFIADTPT